MNKLFCLLLIFTFFSPAFSQKMSREQYIAKYYAAAVEEMNLHKIPASITLAQGLLETESGNSDLCIKAKNHFGIKCKLTWTGMKFIKDDDTKDECFRAYTTDQESYRDHSLFLKGERYAKLFSYDVKDYRSWAYGLKECGYATNPKYPQMLIKHIEDLKLYEFDSYGSIVAEEPIVKSGTDPNANTPENIAVRKELANHLDLIIVDSAFDIYTLASQKNTSIKLLLQYNDIEYEQSIRIGQNFFLHPKNTGNIKSIHTVELGQSIYDIAQIYGVTVYALRKLNKLETWEQPLVGEKISLNTQRDGFMKTRPFYEVERERAKMNTKIPSVQEINSAQKKTVIRTTEAGNKVEVTRIESISEPTNGEKVWIVHKVDKKETIFKLSKIYECKPDDILTWNNLTVEQGLSIGQLVKINTAYPKGKSIAPPKEDDVEKTPEIPNKPIKPMKLVIDEKQVDTLKYKEVNPKNTNLKIEKTNSATPVKQTKPETNSKKIRIKMAESEPVILKSESDAPVSNKLKEKFKAQVNQDKNLPSKVDTVVVRPANIESGKRKIVLE